MEKKIFLFLKICLGVLFILIAILNFMQLDFFELYIYSSQLFSFNLSSVISRSIIGIQFVLGIGLIVNVYNNIFVKASLLVSLISILFLCFEIIMGEGTMISFLFGTYKITSLHFLILNSIFLIITLLIWRVKPFSFRIKWSISIPISVLLFSIVFILYPPDGIKYFQKQSKIDINLFHQLIEKDSSLASSNIMEGKKILCFYSIGCRYCRLSARKINIMQERLHLSSKNIINIYAGKEVSLTEFYQQTDSKAFTPVFLDVLNFLNLTYGRMPVIVLVNQGKISNVFNYRSISEKKIYDFFYLEN